MNKFDTFGTNMIFVISQPRAGSTLLQRILAAHPAVFSVAEPWLMLHPVYALKRGGVNAEYESSLARQGLDDFLSLFPEGEDVYIEALRGMASALYGRALTVEGKQYFLDKTPRYYLIIKELYRIFPQAKFVCLLRNPLAVLASILETWTGGSTEKLEASHLREDIFKGPWLMAEGIRTLGEAAITVHYEELVDNPEMTVAHLCARLEIPFHPDMIHYGHSAAPRGRFGDQINVHRYDKPVSAFKEKWVEVVSRHHLQSYFNSYLEKLGPELMAFLGYSYGDLRQRLNLVRDEESILNFIQLRDRLEKEVREGNCHVSSMNTLAGIYYLQKEYEDCRVILDRVLEADPENPIAIANLAALQEELKGKLAPENTGRQKTGTEDDGSGRRDELSSVTSSPVPEISDQTGSLKALPSESDEGAGSNPGEARVLQTVDDCRAGGRLKQALDLMNDSRSMDECSLRWVNTKIEILLELGELDRADELVIQGLAMWQQNAQLLNNRALIEIFREHFSQAFQILEEILEINPEDGIARDNLSRLKELRPELVSDSSGSDDCFPGRGPAVSPDMSSDRYRVSAIVSTYACEQFMAGRLRNLLEQSLGDDLEIIVIDSHSPEDERSVVEEFARSHSNIRYLRTEQRETIYQAWNRGIEIARGEFITNANADDRLGPDALAVLADALDQHPELILAYGDYFITTVGNQDFAGHIRCGFNIAPDYSPAIMMEGCHMGSQPLWRRMSHARYGMFDGSYRIAGDYEYWCRLALHQDFLHVPKFLGLYHHNPTGALNRDTARHQLEKQQVWGKYAGRFPAESKKQLTGLWFANLDADPTGYVNICFVNAQGAAQVVNGLKEVLLHTAYPHVISVIDRSGAEDVGDILRSAQRQGIVRSIVRFDPSENVVRAADLLREIQSDAAYQLLLRDPSVASEMNWLTRLMSRMDPALKTPSSGLRIYESGSETIDVNPETVSAFMNGRISGCALLVPSRVLDLSGTACTGQR